MFFFFFYLKDHLPYRLVFQEVLKSTFRRNIKKLAQKMQFFHDGETDIHIKMKSGEYIEIPLTTHRKLNRAWLVLGEFLNDYLLICNHAYHHHIRCNVRLRCLRSLDGFL